MLYTFILIGDTTLIDIKIISDIHSCINSCILIVLHVKYTSITLGVSLYDFST